MIADVELRVGDPDEWAPNACLRAYTHTRVIAGIVSRARVRGPGLALESARLETTNNSFSGLANVG
jgi:hypothetical protein